MYDPSRNKQLLAIALAEIESKAIIVDPVAFIFLDISLRNMNTSLVLVANQTRRTILNSKPFE